MDDLRLLLEELQDVCNQWYNLGLQLGVRPKTSQFSDSRDKLLEILRTWLTTSDNTSWKTLADALRSVGKHWLAGSLEGKYCLTKDMHKSKH